MNFIEELIERGYYNNSTNLKKISQIVSNNKITAYVGFDCTAQSLHVGNLMQIMVLRLLQKHGHKPIIVIGGTTSKIGDPTGKNKLRTMLTNAQIELNYYGIKKSLSKFIEFDHSEHGAILLDNQTWLESIKYIEFLKNYGSLISINRMLNIESIKTRLYNQQNLTFIEFNYMLLQAYDFYHLSKNYNCILQIGGSDQWGNIVTGIDFIKKLSKKEVFGITTPLITTNSGMKMGKTADGAIWLNEELTTPYQYYQYWRNLNDKDILKISKLYAEFDEHDTNNLKHLLNSDINAAKKFLAFTLTKLCHGNDAANKSSKASINTFEKKILDTNLPKISISKDNLTHGIELYRLLVLIKICTSYSISKNLIRNGAIKINSKKISNIHTIINLSYVIDNVIKLSYGKKNHILLYLD